MENYFEIYFIETNAICLLILAIMFFSFIKSGTQGLRGKLFISLLGVDALFCITDIFAGVFRGNTFAGAKVLLWAANMGYLLSTLGIVLLWGFLSMVILRGKIHKLTAIIFSSICGIAALLVLTSPFHGLSFTINDENLYSRGPLLIINNVIFFLGLLIGLIFLKGSKATRIEKKAVIFFPILPFLTAILQFIVYGITIGQVGTTSALLLIYVLLQVVSVNEQKVKTQLLDELTRTDVLTGLKNRRSYIMRLEELKTAEWVGVAFMDLNGLKAVNDNEGHEAGDLFISHFSDILKSIFDESEIFRISGDEFVILSENKLGFTGKINEFLSKNEDISSYGIVESVGKDILDTVREAEVSMYNNKSSFYERTGKDRRK